MSIQSEITRISGNVADALDAIEAKGVTIPTGANSDDLATLIAQIGGGSVVVIDTPDSHGGTIRAITATEVFTLEEQTATPSTSTQNITPSSGYDGLSKVVVNPIPSTYKDTSDADAAAGDIRSGKSGYVNGSKISGSLTSRSASDLTASGATVTVPAGIYDSQATKSVTSGTEGTPVASKGTVTNHSVTVTPGVSNSAGYIAGGAHYGTAVTVTASELISFSTIRTGSTAPSDSLGVDGDIYLQTS